MSPTPMELGGTRSIRAFLQLRSPSLTARGLLCNIRCEELVCCEVSDGSGIAPLVPAAKKISE